MTNLQNKVNTHTQKKKVSYVHDFVPCGLLLKFNQPLNDWPSLEDHTRPYLF